METDKAQLASFDAREQMLLDQVHLPGAAATRAITALLQMHYGWIQLRCKQVLRNEADAMDAAQEVALRVYDQLPRFEGRSSLRTWIGAIATRECISVLRRGERHVIKKHVAALIVLHEEALHEQPDGPQNLDTGRVAHVLGSLTPKSRELLQLRFYQDLSLEEISIVLGISLSAAKMRLYRAQDHFAVEYDVA